MDPVVGPYRLPLTERMEYLVNNEYLSDAVFQVGSKLMFGHKCILTTASEVFYAQFNGHFDEAQQNSPIVVTDIQPSTFEQILRFMYCEKITLTKDNVVDVYYASLKYMLATLNEVCEEFFRCDINEDNVLTIFNDNRRNQFAVIDSICLDIISENPIKMFTQDDFYTLDKRSLELIAQCSEMNCQEKQLADAVQKWLTVNATELDEDEVITASNIIPKRNTWHLKCRMLRSYDAFQYVANIDTNLDISVEAEIAVYGLGIFVGTEKWDAEFTANLKIQIDRIDRRSSKAVSFFSDMISVPVQAELYIQEVLIEKLVIDKNVKCTIRVNVETSEGRAMFGLQSFTPVNRLDGLGLNITNSNGLTGMSQNCNQLNYRNIRRFNGREIYYNNSVAYLLYNVSDTKK